MRKAEYFDFFVNECQYFEYNTDTNNGYGCSHPEQSEKDGKQGKCYCWSCPMGYPADKESLQENDIDWEDGKPDKNGMEENSYIISKKLRFRRWKDMTNREVLIESLKYPDGDECTVDYISCPYTFGHECDYDGGTDHTPCTYCKMEWLDKEWDD